ncbi:polyadenylate-binding protein-interacting protein 12 isoform X2 [Cornus florida]|uniref:polyadenylate-binding protein-interacting protein 12 isoform X2 n=1 Tax=Cornus florida TaxID=4283 RepID=UPI00289F3B8B|nr:polyadenylate-binding protein-interacting protein 12 isoform X2 [Cornus florida]
MAVVENAAMNVGSSNRTDSRPSNDVVDQSKPNHVGTQESNGSPILGSNDQNFPLIVHQQQQQKIIPQPTTTTVQTNGSISHKTQMSLIQHSISSNGVQNHQMMANSVELLRNGDDGGEGFKREMRDLEEMLSKLNPLAEEFVPPSLANNGHAPAFGYANDFVMHTNSGVANGNTGRRKKNSYTHGKRRMNTRTSMAQREDVIRRTVYVSDIDHQVTEEQLAALFISCGQVVDCRVCGDPNSVLRFAFIEFTDEEGARNALSLAGTMLGYYPVRVLPSKTAIAPVNPTFLPRSEDEREMCARTIYCTNIDKKVTQADVKLFFESICGEVHRLRLLGDYHHSTRIAFVEFVMAESAIAALNCSGAVLGSLPIRVSPSKTPVRPRPPRPTMH